MSASSDRTVRMWNAYKPMARKKNTGKTEPANEVKFAERETTIEEDLTLEAVEGSISVNLATRSFEPTSTVDG